MFKKGIKYDNHVEIFNLHLKGKLLTWKPIFSVENVNCGNFQTL
jgi:hypothetical protein